MDIGVCFEYKLNELDGMLLERGRILKNHSFPTRG
jgi:hypothetical protein